MVNSVSWLSVRWGLIDLSFRVRRQGPDFIAQQLRYFGSLSVYTLINRAVNLAQRLHGGCTVRADRGRGGVATDWIVGVLGLA